MKKLLISILLIAAIIGAGYIVAEKKAQIDSLPTPKINPITIKIEKPKPMQIDQTIDFIGKYYSLDRALIATKFAGFIKKIYVKEGDTVKKGEPLIKVDDSELELAIKSLKNKIVSLNFEINSKETEVKSALYEAKVYKKIFQRDQKLFKAGVLAKEKLEISKTIYLNKLAKAKLAQSALKSKIKSLDNLKLELKNKIKLMDYVYIKSPFNATIEKIYIKEGSFAPVGKQIMSILSNNWCVDIEFNEKIEKESIALINGEKYSLEILPYSKNGLKVARVKTKKLSYPNNSFIEIKIIQKSKKGFALPISSLYEKDNQYFVFIYKNKRFYPKKIEILAQNKKYFIPKPSIKEWVAVGSNDKLSKLFFTKNTKVISE